MARLHLEDTLREAVAVRSVRSVSETEGVGVDVVVLGGSFPIAELFEVRAHPSLFDKPVVLFAPGKEIPPMDWRFMQVTPVLRSTDATGALLARVDELLNARTPEGVPPRTA